MEKRHHSAVAFMILPLQGEIVRWCVHPVPQGAALGYALLPLRGAGRLIGHKGRV